MTSAETDNDNDNPVADATRSSSSPPTSTALTRRESGLGALARPLRTFGRFHAMRHLLPEVRWLACLRALSRHSEDREYVHDRERRRSMFLPGVEIAYRGDRLIVNVDLPGLSASELRVTAQNGVLTVEGECRGKRVGRVGGMWTSERSFVGFRRVIRLPGGRPGLDLASAEARFENGVLEISIHAPRSQHRRRLIEIKTGSR